MTLAVFLSRGTLLWLTPASHAQFASFREVMMQALVGDEMRESPYLVLRVPPLDTRNGGLSDAKAETPVIRMTGFTLGLERDARQNPDGVVSASCRIPY